MFSLCSVNCIRDEITIFTQIFSTIHYFYSKSHRQKQPIIWILNHEQIKIILIRLEGYDRNNDPPPMAKVRVPTTTRRTQGYIAILMVTSCIGLQVKHNNNNNKINF